MGYPRQSIAIGLFFYALTLLFQNKKISYFFLILMASTFHVSAIILLLFLLYKVKLSIIRIIFFGLIFLTISLIFYYLFSARINNYLQDFIFDIQHNSSAAFIRHFLNIFTYSIFLIMCKVYKNDNLLIKNKDFFNYIYFILLILTPFVFVYSSLFDRFTLYFTCIQLYSMTYCLRILQDYLIKYIFYTLAVVMYFLILYVWLNYSPNSIGWMPYNIF